MAATLKQAVVALFSSTSEKERSEANTWLMAYAATSEAWEGAHGLLSDSDEQVAYFGANLLFMKVRSEWHGLPEATKTAIYGAVRQVIVERSAAAGPEWSRLTPALKRLCLVLAGAAVRSSAVESFAREALGMISESSGTGAPAAVELLTALPQEIIERSVAGSAAANGGAGGGGGGVAPGLARQESLDIQGRPEVRALVPQVLSLLVATTGRWGTGASPTAVDCTATCLRCLQHWLSLQLGCSLLQLVDTAPVLLSTALTALSSNSSSESLHTAAADCIVELLSASNTQFSPGAERAVQTAHAMAEQLQQVAHTMGIAEAEPGAAFDERQYHFCRVLGAFAERTVDLVAATDGRLLPLVNLLFGMLGSELRVAELTIDFWVGLQDTPLAQRHEHLRQPLYRELMRRLLVQCTLPADFTTWDDCDAYDQEEFARFREQSAAEVFGVCLQLLDAEFIAALRKHLAPPMANWQVLELVLFASRSLHAELKGVLSRDADAGSALPPEQLEAHKLGVESLLLELIAPIAEGRVIGQPSPLVASACRLVGCFGKWLAREQPAMLEGCVRTLLAALSVEEAAEHAAVAFRALCVHAQRALGRLETVQALIAACEPSIANAELSSELRIALAEGLARLVAALPVEAAQTSLTALLSPPCVQLQLLLAALPPMPPPGGAPPAAPPADAADSAATQMLLVASSIRFCDRFLDPRLVSGHPVLPVLQGCWPLLMQAAATFRGHAGFVQALSELHTRCMGTLKVLLLPLLPQILQQLSDSFSRTPVVGVLTCLQTALETYGGSPQEEVAAALGQVLTVIVRGVCNFVSTAADPESQPELLTAFWEMCHRCLVCQPALLLSLPCSPDLFDVAIACVPHQEFQHTRAALTFVCLFMCPTESADEYRETSAMCLQKAGARLLAACLSGLVSASPENLVDHQIEVLRVLLEACPTAAHKWLREMVAAPGFTCGAASLETVGTFATLVLQQPALSTSTFQCVASDFSRICRGKLGADALGRYATPSP